MNAAITNHTGTFNIIYMQAMGSIIPMGTMQVLLFFAFGTGYLYCPIVGCFAWALRCKYPATGILGARSQDPEVRFAYPALTGARFH